MQFIAQCGFCPGFTASGLRLRSAWIGHDMMTADTVAEWKLIEVEDLKPALACRARPVPPDLGAPPVGVEQRDRTRGGER